MSPDYHVFNVFNDLFDKDKQLQEAQYKAAASIRETELLQGNVKNLKDKVLQLQELLANREQDHK